VSSAPVPVSRAARRHVSVHCLGLLMAVLAAGCTGGLPAVSGPPVEPGSPAPPLPSVAPVMTGAPPGSPTSPTTVTPEPTEIPGPPAAGLTPIDGRAVPGELGGFTWRGMGSDAPWLVPPPDRALRETGPYAVTFVPPVPVERWTAAWARLVDGSAGAIAGSEQGARGPVVFNGPRRPGTWSLRLDVRFAGGGRCAYYWRLEGAP
jgi:hypothetical protein